MHMPSTGLVFNERFLLHDTGVEAVVKLRDRSFDLSPEPHPAAVSIIRRTKEFLDLSGLTNQMLPIDARAATEDELAVYHTREYIAGVQACASGKPWQSSWGEIDEETRIGPGSYEAALYAAGGAINAVSAVVNGEVCNAFALLRPPCHHAMSDKAWGFCIFNNTVVAAHYARRVLGVERIMIVDWDVHHGNGTQDAFYGDPDVLFVSLHQENWFPKQWGTLEQVGTGQGRGYTVNIPLPPGTGDRGYCAAFEQLVVPIGLQFRPQLIMITAGQDASWLDPLAQMMMTMDGYRQLTQIMMALAEKVCAGRLVVLQAGGYSAPYVPYCTAAIVEALTGADLGIVDLYADTSELERCQSIFSAETQEALQAARTWHKQWWSI
jgi:acetoin utilization deacetylase AcuC-like enzyme